MAQKKTKTGKPSNGKAAKTRIERTPAKPAATTKHSATFKSQPKKPAHKPIVIAKTSAAKATAQKKVPIVKASAKKIAPVKPVAAAKPAVVVAKPKPAALASVKIVVAKPAVAPVAAKPVAVAKPAPVVAAVAKAIPAAAVAARVTPVAAPIQRVMPAAVAKPAGQIISQQAATPKALAEKAARARQLQMAQQAAAAPSAEALAAAAAAKKPVSQRHGFKTNEFIVYPSHGVGRIVGIEEQEIAGMALELFVITFEKDKMTLRVPTGKSQSVGMRKLSDDGVVKRAMETLKGKARIKRTMWSRRAQEFEAKINSGDLVSIAEVVRDLYRSDNQPEQSYSERQLYEAALDRMAREIAAVERLDDRGATQRIVEVLSKSAKGRRAAADEEAAAAGASAEVEAA